MSFKIPKCQKVGFFCLDTLDSQMEFIGIGFLSTISWDDVGFNIQIKVCLKVFYVLSKKIWKFSGNCPLVHWYGMHILIHIV